MLGSLKEILKNKLSKEELAILPRGFEIIGNIAIIQLPKELEKRKKIIAGALLKHKNIRTVALKVGKVKGRLRKRKLQIIAGERKKETIHRENNCIIKLNVESCYFSSRLADDRLNIARQVKKKEKILVMFAGVLPYALVIAKLHPDAKIMAIELNREAVKYGKENIKLNKFKNIELIQGNVKKIVLKLKKKFSRIIMPRPQLRETFLKEAFMAARKNCIIHFYDFLYEKEIPRAGIEKIEKAAKKARKKIKILAWKKVGEIAPYKFRTRIDFKIL